VFTARTGECNVMCQLVCRQGVWAWPSNCSVQCSRTEHTTATVRSKLPDSWRICEEAPIGREQMFQELRPWRAICTFPYSYRQIDARIKSKCLPCCRLGQLHVSVYSLAHSIETIQFVITACRTAKWIVNWRGRCNGSLTSAIYGSQGNLLNLWLPWFSSANFCSQFEPTCSILTMPSSGMCLHLRLL
jgi:hypothetical protein